jgi:hypothetical protein
MKRTLVQEEVRKMRFEEAYAGWNQGRLSQEEAAELLGLCARSFRRYLGRYEADGEAGLLDRRLENRSARGAPADEVLALREQYRERYGGWNMRHFFNHYQSDGGKRSYTWVRKQLQTGGLVTRGKRKGQHRKKRDRKPLPGMMIHQDGSRHEWLSGQWHDLIVTMDDATGEVYSMFLAEEEGTASSFAGMREVIESRGLPGSFYSDRGSHYWHTPQAGGKVAKDNPTQFGRAMRQLNIQMIAAYSPQARGRSERQFKTLQERLPKELALAGITTLEAANRFIREEYRERYNGEFQVAAREEGSAFVPWVGGDLGEILCEHHERTVSADNCVKFGKRTLQLPADKHRCHYVKAGKYIVTRMDAWGSFMVQGNWLAIQQKERRWRQQKRQTRSERLHEVPASAAVCQLPTGYALRQLAYGMKKRTI